MEIKHPEDGLDKVQENFKLLEIRNVKEAARDSG